MTVSSSTDRKSFPGNGATTAFSLPFRFFANSDVVARSIVDSTGVATPLTLGIDYSLSGAGQPEEAGAATGVLTTTAPVPAGVSLFVQRIIPATQPTDIVNQGRFFPEVHETVFDRLTMLVQQGEGALNRALRVQDYDPVPGLLPGVVQRANRILSFDENGSPVAIDAARDSSLVLRQELAATKGTELIGLPAGGTLAAVFNPVAGESATKLPYVSPGTGAAVRSVGSKLADIVSRDDFTVLADFTAAASGRVAINGNGQLDATVKPTGGGVPVTLADTARDALLQFAQGPREALVYGSATTVKVSSTNCTMGGFRYRGKYTAGMAPTFPLSSKTASVAGVGLGAESAVRTENWYAVFACANDGDASAVLKTMPFLRVGSVAGSVVTLNKAGEGIHTVTAQTYAWSASNNLANTPCLVIGEAAQYSGRLTTITANDSTSVTLASVGTLAFGDFLLPAPPGFGHFCYLGSFYFDTAEVRNIYDNGLQAFSKGIYISSPSSDGSRAAPGITMDCAGYISPLATGVTLDSGCNMSTASLGDYAEYFSPDSGNHTVRANYDLKDTATSRAFIFGGVSLAFLHPQKFNFSNGGSLAASRSGGKFDITGWFEP